MYSLGIDLGSSSVKTAVYDVQNNKVIASAQFPSQEMPIESQEIGWAEQHPEMWWENFIKAYQACLQKSQIDSKKINWIGISYQMHGLVCLDKSGVPLRNAIIWCDSRAIHQGQNLSKLIGIDTIQTQLLNEPGNFTVSKLLWVKEFEPDVYEQIDKICLPGDYIAYKLTGTLNTTIGGLSEGVFYDFKNNEVSKNLFEQSRLNHAIIPEVHNSFANHGQISKSIARELGLSSNALVTYKAGDQPNNAFSLNVIKPGEVATTAGTSGVIYAVTDQLVFDEEQRFNTFAHVNYTPDHTSLGSLLCINGVGISNAWIKRSTGSDSYLSMNKEADKIPAGSEGIRIFPFGNGAERMFNNQVIGASISGIDYLRHHQAHLFRATLEGVAFSFQYGIGILRNSGIQIQSMKAGNANMYLSPIFREVLVSLSEVPIYLYDTDGAAGAAKGALVGAETQSIEEVHNSLKIMQEINPNPVLTEQYTPIYHHWKQLLDQKLKQILHERIF